MKTLVLIAAYNEARSIGDVLAVLMTLGYGVVVIDDGSSDDTAAVARDAGVVVLRHCVNLGQGAALQTGLDYARKMGAEIAVTFDADGQHLASDIAPLLAAMNNADVALGSRFLGQAIGLGSVRKKLLKATVWFTNKSTGLKLTDAHNGLRAFRLQALGYFRIRQNRMAHASELLTYIAAKKLRYVEVPCTIQYTPYSIAKGQRILHAINIAADLLLLRLRT